MIRAALGLLIVVAITLFCSGVARGETIVMDGTLEHVIEVPEGETLVMETSILRSSGFWPTLKVGEYLGLIGRTFTGQDRPCILPGPCSVNYSKETVAAVTIRRLRTSAIKRLTLFYTGNTDTLFMATGSITIPPGQKLRFFPTVSASSLPFNKLTIIKGQSRAELPINQALPLENMLFEGPSSVELSMDRPAINSPDTYRLVLVPYYFQESAEPIPGLATLAVSPGGGNVIVEKSTDLKSWLPVSIQVIDAQEKTFFRFGISR